MDTLTLQQIKAVTGISRNQISEVMGYNPNAVARWETDPSLVPADAKDNYDQFLDDFKYATDCLDDDELTWDDVMPIRIMAMKLGVSPHTANVMLNRRKRYAWDFGTLGLWVTEEDLTACRRPM